MRQALSNANADLCATQPRYVVQITGDNPEGKRELDNFIDPEKPYPVIATTSKLMSTGVDAADLQAHRAGPEHQVDDLFKQIIGRGTRLREDYGKTWFTILDFKRATELFADPDFDGDPVQIYEPKGDDPIAPPEPDDPAQPVSPEFGDGAGATRWARSAPWRRHRRCRRAQESTSSAAWSPWPWPASACSTSTPTASSSPRACATTPASTSPVATTRSTASCRPGQRRPQGRADRGTGRAGRADRRAGRRGGPDLDPFDLLLHVAYDHAAAHPARTRQPREEAQRLHPVRPGGPPGAGRAARQVRRRRHHHHREPTTCCSVQPFTELGARRSWSAASAAARSTCGPCAHWSASCTSRNPTAPPPEWGEKYSVIHS
jgi:hypothetical protein